MRREKKGKVIRASEVIRHDIIDNFAEYENLLSCIKTTKSTEVVIHEVKQHHSNFLILRESLGCKMGIDIKIGVEMQVNNYNLFSAWIESVEFPNCHLMRFDAKGGAHKIKSPDIPLKDQMIETPHIHKFENDGVWHIYRTKECDYVDCLELGFPFFCNESKVKTQCDEIPQIKIFNDGALQFPNLNAEDPNENISFA